MKKSIFLSKEVEKFAIDYGFLLSRNRLTNYSEVNDENKIINVESKNYRMTNPSFVTNKC